MLSVQTDTIRFFLCIAAAMLFVLFCAAQSRESISALLARIGKSAVFEGHALDDVTGQISQKVCAEGICRPVK